MKTLDQAIRKVVARATAAAKAAGDLPDPEAGALAVLGTATQPVRNQMAYLFVAQRVREELRAESTAASRRASRLRRRRDSQLDEDLRAAEEAHRRTMRAGIAMILNDYAQNLKANWTKDLLQSPFSLGDGSYVIFGEASEVEHEEKIEIYVTNVVGNLESAAMHLKAIAQIRAAGAKTLNEALA